MALTLNVPAGETVNREDLISYLNVGTDASPEWSPFGVRTEDSSIEYDWSEETSQDILGNIWTTMKKPKLSQSFDPWKLSGGDKAQEKLLNLAVVEQNARALTNQDVMIAHFYLTDKGSTAGKFAERYKSCMVKPTGLGGAGGGPIDMPIDVVYGGERTAGTVSKGTDGAITFAPGTAAAASEE